MRAVSLFAIEIQPFRDRPLTLHCHSVRQVKPKKGPKGHTSHFTTNSLPLTPPPTQGTVSNMAAAQTPVRRSIETRSALVQRMIGQLPNFQQPQFEQMFLKNQKKIHTSLIDDLTLEGGTA